MSDKITLLEIERALIDASNAINQILYDFEQKTETRAIVEAYEGRKANGVTYTGIQLSAKVEPHPRHATGELMYK